METVQYNQLVVFLISRLSNSKSSADRCFSLKKTLQKIFLRINIEDHLQIRPQQSPKIHLL